MLHFIVSQTRLTVHQCLGRKLKITAAVVFSLCNYTAALFKNDKGTADHYIKKLQDELLQHTDSGK